MQKSRKLKDRGTNTESVISLIHLQNSSKYALTERNVQHIRIKDTSELNNMYLFREEIGQGGFGTVIAATEVACDKEWAIKIVIKSSAGPFLKFIKREIRILKLVHHPHIIYLDKVFESPRKIYMVLERCYGELYDIYKKNKPFSEEISRKIISEVLSAVAYLHIHDIVHRDLKMENILIAKNPNDPADIYYTKLTDFGLSVVKSGTGVESMLDERCGTLMYMSPEMITKEKYSQLCDLWAIGVILYMLIVGEFPFHDLDDRELIDKISTKEPHFPQKMSHSAKQLVIGLLQKDPVKRLTAGEALEHPWIKGNDDSSGPISVLEQMNKWRSELMLPTQQSSMDYFGNTSKTKLIKQERTPSLSDGKPLTKVSSKMPLPMPVTNIKFNKHQNRVSLEKISVPKLDLEDEDEYEKEELEEEEMFSTATAAKLPYKGGAGTSAKRRPSIKQAPRDQRMPVRPVRNASKNCRK